MIQRIGLFGGTFDPIHNGHLRLAEMAEMECGLQKIIFLPAAFPPHKSPTRLTSFQLRAEMLRLALVGRTGYEYSFIEAELPPPSYTIDTLRFFNESWGKDANLFFLIGIDAFLEIRTWKGYDELLRTVSFVVSEREGNFIDRKHNLAQKLNYKQEDHLWQSIDGKQEVCFLRQPPLSISSSAVREAVRTGVAIRDLVPATVHQYIVHHGLYRTAIE